MFVIHI